MSKFAHGVMPANELHSGLKTLKKRQRNFMLLFFISISLLISTAVAGFFQQELVYGFFGLSPELSQLHIPVAAEQLGLINPSQDYFMSLLAWLGWLILKVCVSFVGAFIVVALLKKIRFFYVRFQSFVLKFVGWLIAFIVLWSGLTYLQYDIQDDQDQAYTVLTEYSQHISDSVLYQELTASQLPKTVQAYLLAQTALLHEPSDLAAAKPYVEHLRQAEQIDQQFNGYGFKAEQLWSMQQQVYGKSMTPTTQALATQVAKIENTQQQVQLVLIIAALVWSLLSVMFWLLAHYFARRSSTIQQRIEL